MGLLALLVALVALSGCPLNLDEEETPNEPPFTFFNATPPDTTFRNDAFFRWIGTDLDNDVVAYQYQLVFTDQEYYESAGQTGTVISSVDPRGGPEQVWTDRRTDAFQTFSELEDGWYEMRARSIDADGAESEAASFRFYLFYDDVSPRAIIGTIDAMGNNNQGCGRIGTPTAWTFLVNGTDESRNTITPRNELEYQFQLVGRTASLCETPIDDDVSDWEFFPASDPDPIQVFYTGLLDPACPWDFRLSVRDAAGNIGSASCCITREGSCQ